VTPDKRLTLRVLGALLREDVVGLRTRSTLLDRPDGPWLRLTGGPAVLLLPVAADGFQCEYAARLPLLRREPTSTGTSTSTGPSPAAGTDLTSCDDILRALRDLADPEDRPGFDAYAAECRQTLATMRLHDAVRATVHERLARRYGEDPGTWTGMAGSLAFDTLAAYLDHPVYPTARGRAGLTDDQLRAYAPEFHPTFTLRWATVHAPQCAPPCAPITLPVHPLTAGALPPGAVLTDRPGPQVVPTLSMRTVALAHDPAQHIKLPLPTSTLGLRNRRTIKPGTLIDGAAGQRLLEAVIAREPRFRGTILQADEQRFDHAGHELLAALYRRYPPGLDSALIVPLAALLAPEPGGRRLIDRLADRFYDGDPLALLDTYLTLLFDWQTTLFSYGIALESHQQNTSLVLDRPHPAARTRLRLLFKDNDGPRVNAGRIRPHGLPADFDDPRTFTDHDQPLIDMFTTITVHLCAGALAFGLPAHRDRLLRLIRDRLDAMAGPVLRQHLLDADRLPVKAMVTAGTLLSKERSGAADINKHYTSGPNYLRRLPIS
jgi:hypothetical protein